MRQITIQPGLPQPFNIKISLIRDEPLRLIVGPEVSGPFVFTVSLSPGGVVVVEIPSVSGQFDLEPHLMQALIEGHTYYYNIWATEGGSPFLCVKGALFVSPSIAPSGVDEASVIFSNYGQSGAPQRMAVVSQSEYDSLPSLDPDTLYLIREVTP